MNRTEFETSTEMTDFCKSCMEDEFSSSKEIYRELWEKANDINEFKELVRNDNRVRMEQATAKLLEGDWKFLRSMLGNKQFKTVSDVGGVKVGTDDFSIIVPNGYGDGTTRVAILEHDELNHNAFNFFTSISGKANIYSYDCGSEVCCTLNGRYGVFYKDGFVVFQK